MRKKIDKQVRVDLNVYNELVKLCDKNDSKSLKSEVNFALLYFIRIGIAPSTYNTKKLETVIDRLEQIDKNISKQNADFKLFINKSLDRQFGFLKEFEKYNIKKLEEFANKHNSPDSNLMNEMSNMILLGQMNTQAVFFAYDLMIDIAKMQLGIYDTAEIPDWEDMDTEDITKQQYENFKKHIADIMHFFQNYQRSQPDTENSENDLQ